MKMDQENVINFVVYESTFKMKWTDPTSPPPQNCFSFSWKNLNPKMFYLKKSQPKNVLFAKVSTPGEFLDRCF